MTDPGLRADRSKDIPSKLTPPLSPGKICTRITVDDKAAVLAEALLLTAKIAPPIWRKQGSRGWCATEEEKAKLHSRWAESEDARTRLRAIPNERSRGRSLKVAT